MPDAKTPREDSGVGRRGAKLLRSETLRHPALRVAVWLTWHYLEAKERAPSIVRVLFPF